MKQTIFWFRRDLRTVDNRGLQQAIGSGLPVMSIFIVDMNIVDELPDDDPRFFFIYEQLELIHRYLRSNGSSLLVLKGDPHEIWKSLISSNEIDSVYVNRDYEPYAVERDRKIEALLRSQGIPLHIFKDQVIFEAREIVKNDGKPYTVFTPFKRKWLWEFQRIEPEPRTKIPGSAFSRSSHRFPLMSELGFRPSIIRVRPYDISNLDYYSESRDFPALDSTSYLSPHLRFGTISIRQVVNALGPFHETFLGELIWREFFMQILHHFPQVVDHNFNRKYNGIEWRNNEEEFQTWCKGETGYPLVDAGMRQLNQTGYMHNRVRMVTAGFLCKHLLIDWRWGEAYFAEKLLDYELSSNNGNWQWAAGTGCDAAPYFRIFNPHEQLRKFDKELVYVRKWVPEYGTAAYKAPLIDHRFARSRALETYKKGFDAHSRDH